MSKNKKFRIISFKNSKPILKAKNISKIIDNRPILQNLNLSINPSEIVGLLWKCSGDSYKSLISLLQYSYM